MDGLAQAAEPVMFYWTIRIASSIPTTPVIPYGGPMPKNRLGSIEMDLYLWYDDYRGQDLTRDWIHATVDLFWTLEGSTIHSIFPTGFAAITMFLWIRTTKVESATFRTTGSW